ncbi:MAG: response regulator [Bacillota bacterium]|nr:response regulator [Bacillota bacterium]
MEGPVYDITIILVDDDEGHLELIKEYLLDEGYIGGIKEFSSGIEALRWLNEKKKLNGALKNCIIITDIRMPVMDGIEMISKIKSDEELKGIPILVFTTSDEKRDVDKCYNAGCNCFLSKPTIPGMFPETIKNLISIMKNLLSA